MLIYNIRNCNIQHTIIYYNILYHTIIYFNLLYIMVYYNILYNGQVAAVKEEAYPEPELNPEPPQAAPAALGGSGPELHLHYYSLL